MAAHQKRMQSVLFAIRSLFLRHLSNSTKAVKNYKKPVPFRFSTLGLNVSNRTAIDPVAVLLR